MHVSLQHVILKRNCTGLLSGHGLLVERNSIIYLSKYLNAPPLLRIEQFLISRRLFYGGFVGSSEDEEILLCALVIRGWPVVQGTGLEDLCSQFTLLL